VLQQHRLEGQHDARRLLRLAARPHAQVDVRPGQLEIIEKHLRHIVVVMLALWNTSYSNLDSVQEAYSTGLAGVHQELLKVLLVVNHLPHDGGGFHEVGTGAGDVDNLHYVSANVSSLNVTVPPPV